MRVVYIQLFLLICKTSYDFLFRLCYRVIVFNSIMSNRCKIICQILFHYKISSRLIPKINVALKFCICRLCVFGSIILKYTLSLRGFLEFSSAVRQMPGDLCTAPRIISLSPLSIATDVTDTTLGASGLWLGTRTGGGGTIPLA